MAVIIFVHRRYRKRHRQQELHVALSETKKELSHYEVIPEKTVINAQELDTIKKDNPLYETVLEKVVSGKLNTCKLICIYNIYYVYCYITAPVVIVSEEEVRTSVGQPTTLHITVKGNPMPEINWTKNDGDPVDHLILQDGSLYINPTTEDDQGRYTMTATNSEGKSSKSIKLVVLNPQFVPSKLCIV